MDDDFALIDFALVAAAPDAVAQAMATVLAGPVGRAKAGRGGEQAGLMSRLLHRGAGSDAAAPLTIQPRGSLGPEPLVRHVLDDFGAAAAERLVRISAPVGENDLTLVEFREIDGDESPVAAGLSTALRNQEVFYFRLSGARHPGAHYAFHVYQNGLASRRAMSRSPRGTAPEAPWEGIDAGIFHPLETDSLSPPEAPRWAIMSPERQASILEALGIDPMRLFEAIPDRAAVLVLSPAEGGVPISEASRHMGPRLRGPATFSRSAAAEPPRTEPASGAAPAEEARPPAPLSSAPKAERGDTPSPAAAAPAPGDPVPADAGAWEKEVTALLLRAVEAALPEAERVPWLEALTRLLEAGQVTLALSEARALIGRARLPEQERERMAGRLALLFAPAPQAGS